MDIRIAKEASVNRGNDKLRSQPFNTKQHHEKRVEQSCSLPSGTKSAKSQSFLHVKSLKKLAPVDSRTFHFSFQNNTFHVKEEDVVAVNF
jgi:hypothetical protein